MNVEPYTDREIVEAILKNDSRMIEYFFCRKCSRMLLYIAVSMFDNRVDRRELVNELLLYIAADGWRKLSQFDFRSSLMTWMSVVAIRFFQKRRADLIESDRPQVPIREEQFSYLPAVTAEQRMDLDEALRRMKNPRYREVIQALDLEDRQPEVVAEQLSITVVDNRCQLV